MPLLITLASLVAAALCGTYALHLKRTERLRAEARIAALSASIDPAGDGPAPLFAAKTGLLARGRPLLRAVLGVGVTSAAIGAVMAAGALIAAVRHDTASRAAASAPSLALLSMQHERQAASLTVTGLVRNQGQTSASHITAVVAVFDRAGHGVATAVAPLDRERLEPGDDSPFRVAIPHVEEVGRYRVSFRNEAGLVRHVDRRPPGAEPSAAIALR